MNSITKNATIITGSLIFLGFCRYYFYYQAFDISIYEYLSTSELLLSFLPVIVSTFIPIAIFGYLALIMPEKKFRTSDGKDISNRIKKWDEVRAPLNLIRHLFNSRHTTKTKFKIFIILLTNPLTVSFVFLLVITVIFWQKVFKDNQFHEIEPLFYFISFGWIIFIIEPFIFDIAVRALIEKQIPHFKRNIALINYFLIVVYFICFSQKFTAWKKISGEEVETVQVKLMSNDIIRTNKFLIYIGRTNNYIFFRDMKDSSNLIFSTSNILDMKKSFKK